MLKVSISHRFQRPIALDGYSFALIDGGAVFRHLARTDHVKLSLIRADSRDTSPDPFHIAFLYDAVRPTVVNQVGVYAKIGWDGSACGLLVAITHTQDATNGRPERVSCMIRRTRDVP